MLRRECSVVSLSCCLIAVSFVLGDLVVDAYRDRKGDAGFLWSLYIARSNHCGGYLSILVSSDGKKAQDALPAALEHAKKPIFKKSWRKRHIFFELGSSCRSRALLRYPHGHD